MRRIVLTKRPNIDPVPEDFTIEDVPTPEPGLNQILVETLWLSIDPYVRLTLDEILLGGAPGLPLGQSPLGRAVSRVIKSNHPNFAIGDLIEGRTAWAEQAIIDPETTKPTKLDFGNLPLSYAVGALGMPGQTAYAGMIDIGRTQAGDTVLISAAAGAVGTMAGQIGKILGARVVGIAGGQEKCSAVKALGFDECVDYKAPHFEEKLAAALPNGFQVYFENVGGDMTRRILPHATYSARMPLCGLLAIYGTRNEQGPDQLPEFMRLMFLKGLEIKAFHGESVGGAHAIAANRQWIEQGKFRPAEVILNGIEAVPAGFSGIFRGNKNVGKVVVKIR